MILRTRTTQQAIARQVQTRAAFTLMEMVVVVAIIVMLAGLGGFYFLKVQRDSAYKTAYNQVKTTLTQAVEVYASDHNGVYPGSLRELVDQSYLKTPDALIDPWGNEYQYDPNGSRNGGRVPDIFTIAPDGTEIGNWPKQ